jgi:plasmid maintenance system antidote protein VapI
MAIRFEKTFEISAYTLMRMQAAYELACARAHKDEIRGQPIAKAA